MFVLMASLLGIYILSTAFALIRNLSIARTIGVPVVWSPISPFNPFWILFNKSLSPLLQRLPFGLGEWTKHNSLDWTWIDRAHRNSEMHQRYGETFVHVTPREIEIHTRDPSVSDQVLRRKSAEFEKISHYAKILDVFGPSLVSSDGLDWNRHRKITVSSLSDKNNRLVWSEAIRQTQQMTDYYMQTSEGMVIDAVEDTRKLYLHVFTGVCFGVAYDYMAPAEQYIPKGHIRSYKDCLHTTLKDLLILRLVPNWAFKFPSLPQRIVDFREASTELLKYLDEMISSAERQFRDNKKDAKANNLLDYMVWKSEEMREEEDDASSRNRLYLTGAEVRGNLFTYSLGGHESAAHTLTFSLYLLAAFPKIQDWLLEELDAVLGHENDLLSSETFTRAFPKLTRSLAIMHETLRLYPSVTVLPKCTGSTPSIIDLEGRERNIPAGVNVYVNMPSIQVHPAIWGNDAAFWKPSRWIALSQDASQGEQLRPSLPGAFVAWSEGKRVCPGRRFSQVAFVAALATLFLKYRADVVPDEGETYEDARERTLTVVNDTYAITTVYMRNPQSVKIKMVQRVK
ncbi:cytochrome P450 [Plenodomus tracheiphilus IPT5]|uniref:Cytochrome P450 n=1 Tax=Plenodomus tracheiphilus IPT5 TaxID=1408161 RepID=A0A6A7AUB6_9PLEO|nr:cytochrome P450 [Plenodomus tracheiphilus IPT5]